MQVKSLKSGILVEQTCRWKRILRFIGDTLIVHPPFVGVAQKADGAELIDDKDIFERMAFLLAAVIQFSISFITRTINRTFYAIMDKRGLEPSTAADLRAIAAPIRLHCAPAGDFGATARSSAPRAKDAPIC